MLAYNKFKPKINVKPEVWKKKSLLTIGSSYTLLEDRNCIRLKKKHVIAHSLVIPCSKISQSHFFHASF